MKKLWEVIFRRDIPAEGCFGVIVFLMVFAVAMVYVFSA